MSYDALVKPQDPEQVAADAAEAKARADARATRTVAREALLERLGITDEDARMLLS